MTSGREGALVCVGDVFVDLVVDLTAERYVAGLNELKSSSNLFADVRTKVGGGGVQFAVAARRAGFRQVTLIGKVGALARGAMDSEGVAAFDHLREHGVVAALATTEICPTGRVIVIYLPNDRRFMISDPQANNDFDVADITPEMDAALARSEILHVSGYSLLVPTRRKAVLELMRRAHLGGAKVALDLVPHDIDTHVDMGTLLPELERHVDCLFVELPTAHRLAFGRPSTGLPDSVLDASLAWLAPKFSVVVVHVTPADAVIASAGQRERMGFAYEPGVSSRGQSATVQAELLGRPSFRANLR
jgi:sugar/nucleoside kinase (ribokinase family)